MQVFRRTALEFDNGPVHLQILPPLYKSSGSSLKPPRSDLLPDEHYEPLGRDATPAGLNLDGGCTQAQIVPPPHGSLEILLDNGGEAVEAIKASGFEVRQHTRPQEYLRESNLVFVRVRKRLFEYYITERLGICSTLGPLRGVHEHIVTRRGRQVILATGKVG